MDTDKRREQLIKRLEATGQAQSRYLWSTLIACLFFLALQSSPPNAEAQIAVPVVDLKLDTKVVLASGGTIIAFLVLITFGAIRAWSTALRQCAGETWQEDAERLDTHPNPLDLAIYTTSESAIVRFVYPLYLTIPLVEAARLQWWLWHNTAPARVFFLVSWLIVWLRATLLIGGMWLERVKALRSQRRAIAPAPAG